MHKFSTPQRFFLVVIGLGVFLLGAWAVFETENAVGSAALITVGALLTIVGVVGQIAGLKLGDYELLLTPDTQETIRSLADDEFRLAFELRQQGRIEASERHWQIATQLLGLSQDERHLEREAVPANETGARNLSRSELFTVANSIESTVVASISSIVERLGLGRVIPQDETDSRSDLTVRTQHGTITVEIKVTLIGHRSIRALGRQAVDQAFSLARNEPRTAALAVIAGSASSLNDAGILISDQPDARIVVWLPDDEVSDRALANALRELAEYLRRNASSE